MPNSCAIRKFERNERKRLYSEYQSFFVNMGLQLVGVPDDTDWNYWLISLLLENKKDRDLFLKETNENKVMTRPIWRLMHKLPMYKNCQRDRQLNAEFLEARIVNIPSSGYEK